MAASRLSRLGPFLALLLGAFLVTPGLALAAGQPVIERGDIPYSYVASPSDNPCGVEIFVEGEVTFTDHLFFDDAGNLVKVISHVSNTWTETGPAGSVYGKESVNVMGTEFVQSDSYQSWIDTFRGQPIQLSAPGFGVIVRDSGNIALQRTLVFNDPDDPNDDEFSQQVIYEHGDHPTLPASSTYSEDWIPQYCAILAG